jgi:hypothetical protein
MMGTRAKERRVCGVRRRTTMSGRRMGMGRRM